MSTHLQHFFQLCNPDGSRSVDREAFRGLCDRFNITAKDADVIFDDLDHDQDGMISFEDFSKGFSDFMGHHSTENESVCKGQNSEPISGAEHPDNQEVLTKQHAWSTLTSEVERTSQDGDESKFRWLLEELQTTDKRYLVSCLETALEDLLKNMQQLQEEKIQLEHSWKREKQEHEKHLKRMEEEMDSQVKETEMKMRIKAQAEVEDERRSLQSKMDHETDNLQAYFRLVEKVNSWMESQPADSYDVRLDEVRKKLDDAIHENRQLRMSLVDTQTSIAVMRSELLQLRTLYEEKCRELSSEREKILEVLHEQDHLSRQLNLLHDVNKRLQDTNDALRNSMDHSTPSLKRDHQSSLCRGKSGSILGDYFNVAYTNSTVDRFIDSDEDEDADDERNEVPATFLRRARSMDTNFPYCRKTKAFERRLARRNLNHSDSGVSITQDQEESQSSTPESSLVVKENGQLGHLNGMEDDSTQPKRPISLPEVQSTPVLQENTAGKVLNNDKRPVKEVNKESLVENSELPRKKISDIIRQLGIQGEPIKVWTPKRQKAPTALSQTASESGTKTMKPTSQGTMANPATSSETEPKPSTSPTPHPRKSLQSKVQSTKEKHTENSTIGNGCGHRRVSRTLSTGSCNISSTSADRNPPINGSVILEDSEDPFEPNGPPEQTFKVILVGDAGVGKSSFALRISKGVFVRHTSSTLSVDFLMRTIKVDGRNVSIQLWDTAGQERFRSITKSYFRNSDGVMLLYDCTCEYSFLNVRQWVEDVDVSCFYRMMAYHSASHDKSLTNQRIPLMIVANKIDLRDTALKLGHRCIPTEEGERLALACDTTFIEASAKDGNNVLQALANLVRSMSNHKEVQMAGSTMQLSEAKSKKSTCCGR